MASDGPKSGGSGKGGGTTDFSGKRGSASDSVKPNFNPLKKDDNNKKNGSSVASQLLKNENPEDINGPDGEDESLPKENLFTGVGKAATNSVKGKGGAAGFSMNVMDQLKGKGPIGLIIGLVLGFGGLMSGSQSLMPMAIEEMIVEKLNSIGISSTMASDAWLNTQLNQGTKLHHEPSDQSPSFLYVPVEDEKGMANLFAFSDKQVNAFEKQGLKVCQDVGSDNTSMSVILFKDGGQWVPVIGSDMAKYPAGDIIGSVQNACGVSNVGQPLTVSEAMQNRNFKNPYTKASKTWRGGVSGWFDSTMSNITETKLSINRNRWAKYVTSSIKDMTQAVDAFKKTASESRALTGAKDGGVSSTEEITVDENGNKVEPTSSTASSVKKEDVEIEEAELDTTGATQEELAKLKANNDGNTSGVDVKNNALDPKSPGTIENMSKVLNSKAMKVATKVSTAACAILEGMMTIYTTVSAFQSLQFLNLISGYLEAVDKVKAGDGDASPIHEYSNNLTTKADTVDNEKDGNDAIVARKRTAMMSVGMSWLFGMTTTGKDDASVKNVNFENLMSNIKKFTGNIEHTARIYEYCGYAKAATAAVSLVSTVISFIPYVGQAVKAVQITAKGIAKAAVQLAVQIAFYTLIPIAVKHISKLLIKNAATEWFGEDLGNALASGASKYLGGNATSGGMSPGSKSKVIAYMAERETVLADEAEYQRSTKDPFDITSRYTFMGNIMYSLMPFAFSTSSIMSGITNMSSLVSKSTLAMSPTASAWGINDELAATGDCSLLESVGGVGDLFCNPYIITDTSTMNVSPIAVNNIVYSMKDGDSSLATTDYMSLDGNIKSENFDENGKIIDKKDRKSVV